LSEWVFLEYRNASEITGGKIIYANIRSGAGSGIRSRKLAQFGATDQRQFTEIVESKKTIILDPAAEKPLTAEDFQSFKYFVIGGICGDYPPKARTGPMVSSKMPKAQLRHLGKKQLSTDSAVLAVKLVSLGAKMDEIKVTDCLTIDYGSADGVRESMMLPFGYIVLDEKVMITPGLLELLERKRRKGVF